MRSLTRRRSGESPRGAAGFTLIELLVVMTLIGLLFSVGIVNLDFLVPSSRLEKAARDLGDFLARLRGMAVFHGRSYFLDYDLDNHRYRLRRPTTLEEQEEGAEEYNYTSWFDLPDQITFQDIQFEYGDKVTSGEYTIEFTPTGEVVGHVVHLISQQIADAEKSRFTIELNPITGLVSFTRGEKPYEGVRDEYEFR